MASLKDKTYAGLIAAIVDWVNREGSAKVQARAEDFIVLHEARANRVLRDRQQIKRATATLSSGYIKLPTDWAEARQLQINLGTGKPRVLTPVTREQADRIRADGVLTTPKHYCITGNELEIVPYTEEALELEMAYVRKVPALSAAAPTNWLLTDHPDYYLYGSLVHSAPYLRDDPRIEVWGRLADAAQEDMLLAQERAAYSGGRLKTRARLRNR